MSSALFITVAVAGLVVVALVVSIVVVVHRRGAQGRLPDELSYTASHPKDFGPGQPSTQHAGPGAAPAAGSETVPPDMLPSELPGTRDLQPPR